VFVRQQVSLPGDRQPRDGAALSSAFDHHQQHPALPEHDFLAKYSALPWPE